jgi:hypothetical protein
MILGGNKVQLTITMDVGRVSWKVLGPKMSSLYTSWDGDAVDGHLL